MQSVETEISWQRNRNHSFPRISVAVLLIVCCQGFCGFVSGCAPRIHSVKGNNHSVVVKLSAPDRDTYALMSPLHGELGTAQPGRGRLLEFDLPAVSGIDVERSRFMYLLELNDCEDCSLPRTGEPWMMSNGDWPEFVLCIQSIDSYLWAPNTDTIRRERDACSPFRFMDRVGETIGEHWQASLALGEAAAELDRRKENLRRVEGELARTEQRVVGNGDWLEEYEHYVDGVCGAPEMEPLPPKPEFACDDEEAAGMSFRFCAISAAEKKGCEYFFKQTSEALTGVYGGAAVNTFCDAAIDERHGQKYTMGQALFNFGFDVAVGSSDWKEWLEAGKFIIDFARCYDTAVGDCSVNFDEWEAERKRIREFPGKQMSRCSDYVEFLDNAPAEIARLNTEIESRQQDIEELKQGKLAERIEAREALSNRITSQREGFLHGSGGGTTLTELEYETFSKKKKGRLAETGWDGTSRPQSARIVTELPRSHKVFLNKGSVGTHIGVGGGLATYGPAGSGATGTFDGWVGLHLVFLRLGAGFSLLSGPNGAPTALATLEIGGSVPMCVLLSRNSLISLRYPSPERA